MATSKLSVSSKNKVNNKLILIFVALFVLVGVAIVVLTHAGGSITSYSTVKYAKDLNPSQNVKVIKDNIGTVSNADVIYVAPFGKVNFGGFGGVGAPTPKPRGGTGGGTGIALSSTTVCYLMRSDDPYKSASVKMIATDGTSRVATIKPLPDANDAAHPRYWWQKECITSNGYSTSTPYEIAHYGGAPVHIYSQETTYNYGY